MVDTLSLKVKSKPLSRSVFSNITVCTVPVHGRSVTIDEIDFFGHMRWRIHGVSQLIHGYMTMNSAGKTDPDDEGVCQLVRDATQAFDEFVTKFERERTYRQEEEQTRRENFERSLQATREQCERRTAALKAEGKLEKLREDA